MQNNKHITTKNQRRQRPTLQYGSIEYVTMMYTVNRLTQRAHVLDCGGRLIDIIFVN